MNKYKQKLIRNIKECAEVFYNDEDLKVLKIKVDLQLWSKCYSMDETVNGEAFMELCDDEYLNKIFKLKEIDKVYAFGIPGFIILNFENTNYVQLSEITEDYVDIDKVEGIVDKFTESNKSNSEIEEQDIEFDGEKDYGGQDIVSNILNNLDKKFKK